MTNLCPACEKGELSSRVQDEAIEYGGVRLVIAGLEHSECSMCGEEVVLPVQARRNELRYADAKRAHDRLLVSNEIHAWRDRWNLTQQLAATLLGGGVNAFSKYERGEVIQSRSMDLLMRASDQFPGLLEYLAEIAGVELPASEWETVAQYPKSSHSMGERLGVNVVDVTAYRIKRSNLVRESGFNWREDAGLAYGC